MWSEQVLCRELSFPSLCKKELNSILYLSNFPKAARSTLRSQAIIGNWKPFKNGDKCFLFHLQSFWRSQDILSFCFDFLVIYKNSLIRKVRLISKFIKQTTAIHILSNISRNKGVQKTKFAPLIEHNMRNKFVEKIIPKIWWKSYSQTLF